MDSMEYGYCCEQKPKAKKNNCFRLIAEILGVLFAFTIGIIIGAELASTILAAIAAIIVLAIILGILFVLTIILIICKNRKNNRPC